ncbi:MAG TPA: hypothetical protein VKZ65_08155 [Glycomyces sp.]|nr:hypothetical protein [Glycomyces sp.]
MSNKAPSILIGVLAYVILSIVLQFLTTGGMMSGVLSCLVILGSAMAGVWHYTSTNGLTIPAGEGAGIGAAVGVGGALLAGVLSLLLISSGAMPDPADLAVEQMRAQGLTDEQIEAQRGMLELFSSPMMVLLVGGVLGAIVGAIGGVIGASVFKKGGDAPAEPGF